MFEVAIPGVRHGEAKINSSTAYRGMHCYIAGVDSDGYQLMQLPYSSAQGAKAFYPVNKYYFEEDGNDTSNAIDKLTKGDTIIYYEGGEYITDRFNKYSFGLTGAYWAGVENLVATAYGAKLYNPGSSTANAASGTLNKVYVAFSATEMETKGGPCGTLFGDSSYSRGIGAVSTDNYIGFAIGIYYEDSSNAKLRYRIHPSNQSTRLNF